MQIDFNYDGIPSLKIDESQLVGIFQPNRYELDLNEKDIIENGLRNPIGTPRIREMVKTGQKILILTDDYTRTTPVDRVLPYVLQELNKGGIRSSNISILIAQGTHRKMRVEEKQKKLGQPMLRDFPVLDHEWNNDKELIYIGDSVSGVPIWVNRHLSGHDFVIGIGHIVPHLEAGFSGGAKIVQPGVCGKLTTEATHWLAASYRAGELLGRMDNPIRTEIEKIGERAKLHFVINAVQDRDGRIVGLFCGDPIKAHRQGCLLSRKIYGIHIPRLSDIVVIDSYPSDSDLWVAAKAIFAADLAVKNGGVIILVTPCPEGISTEHREILNHRFLPYVQVKKLVEQGKMKNDLVGAAFLAYVGNIIEGKAKCILVSPGIDSKVAQDMGLITAETPQDALGKAVDLSGKESSVTVIRHGSEVLPLVGAPKTG